MSAAAAGQGVLARLAPRRWSVRTQIVVWNSLALALLLAILGLVAHYSVRTLMLASVDRELAMRADHMRGPGRRGPGGPPPGAPQMGPGLLFPGLWPGGPPPAGTEGHGQRRHGPVIGAGGETDDPTDGPAYAPRYIDPSGQVMGPDEAAKIVDPAAYRRALRGDEVRSTVVVDGARLRVLTRPLQFRGAVTGVVQVPYPLRDVERAIAGLSRVLLGLIPVAVVCAGLGGLVLTDRVLRPVRRVTHAAASIGAADLSQRLPVTGHDEFAELASTFNGMLGRLEAVFARQAQMVEELRRMVEQQRRFTADASHELRTPLTVIKANTSLCLQGSSTADELLQSLGDIDGAADRMSRLVHDLLLLSRSDAGQLGRGRTALHLRDLLEAAVAAVSRAGGPEVRVQIANPLPRITGNGDEIVRLFTNLLENAARYTPADGTITVSACESDGVVQIGVTDTGAGIAPEHLPHLGERFYRVDEARTRTDGGAGLGLSICKSIAEAHGGTIAFASEVGAGTTVTVTFPAC